ncbi:helix-turn-helix transcriptional regulator [Roseateles sp.]|uniref:helix-turn-helix transcriptional regulator n=1 Tax=Roseateles sp. TaxID=1971397 RepID=UPI00395FF573
MPTAPKSQSLRRLIELLAAIPAGRSVTPQDLQQELARRGLDVAARTIQRDLRLLHQHFALACDERSKPHGWRWQSAAARNSVLGLSTPEALGLVLLERHLSLALPASWSESLAALFEQARQKLDTLGPHAGPGHWPAKVHVVPPGLGALPPTLPPQLVLAEVSEALLHDRQLQLEYRKPSQAGIAAYRVHPLGLLLRGRALYLVALSDADRHGPPRHFALHRLASATALPQPAQRPPGVDMASAMAQSSGHFGTPVGSAPVLLSLRCEPPLAHLLEEQPLGPDQVLTPEADGRVRVEALLTSSWELRWWLQAHAHELEVLAPAQLRADLRRDLEAALARHRD